jgi:hypothetical protein
MTMLVHHVEGVRERKWIARVVWGSILVFVVLAGVRSQPALAADAITDANVAAAIAAAKTPQDYEAISGYFRAQAAAAGEKVKLHEAMLTSWEKTVSGKALDHMRSHCRGLIASFREQQKENEALAEQYAKLAGGGAKR